MADSEANRGEVFEVERIRSLVELMKEFDLREIDLKEAKQRIRLSRGTEPASAMMATPAAPPAPPPAGTAPAATGGAASAEEEGDAANITVIKSPMVGTFYGRSNPNTDPYVRVGDVVDPETTVCIIEAMKVFNEIPAEVNGRIVAILAEDEDPLEYGKPLFKVDTSGS
ncbi:MAG: acetyl-CoA carboxylase biotin carboxyl carrier protein [Pirellulaceae bacterium]